MNEPTPKGAEESLGPAMSIWEHLDELRSRITQAFLAVLGGTVIGWAQRERILGWLLRPYERAWVERGLPGAPELQTLSPTDVFVSYLQLAFAAGLVLAAPVVLYQLWAFVSPGLYARERRFIVPFVLASSSLFVAGVAFAFYVMLPMSYSYFFSLLGPINAGGTVLTQRPTFEYYLDFATRLIVSTGVVFELPLFLSFLVLAGIVTPRQLVEFSRWAILLSFIIGAVATPGPEISSQILVSFSLIALYFLSIGIAFVLKPRAKS
jgi:sec-independent protein translocase protein TatC